MNRAANGRSRTLAADRHGAVREDWLQAKMDCGLDSETDARGIACGDLNLRGFTLGMTNLNVWGQWNNSLYAVPVCADKM